MKVQLMIACGTALELDWDRDTPRCGILSELLQSVAYLGQITLHVMSTRMFQISPSPDLNHCTLHQYKFSLLQMLNRECDWKCCIGTAIDQPTC